MGDLELDERGCSASCWSATWSCRRAQPDTAEVVRFLSQEISQNTYLNVMAQYRPEYKACGFPDDRRMTAQEYTEALEWQHNGSDSGIGYFNQAAPNNK